MDVPPPQLAGPGVLVQTAASLISAGTERAMTQFAKGALVEKARARPDLVRQVLDKIRRDGLAAAAHTARERLDRPVAPGYAAAGLVLAVAPGIDDLRIGDRVACAGANYATHAEVNYVPKNLAVPIPRRRSGEWVGFDEAAFTTLGAIALHGARLGGPQLGDRAAVIGLGVIGLLAVQVLRAHGCRVVAIDVNPGRCDLARALGAEEASVPAAAAAAVARATNGMGADLVVVAAAAAGSEPAVLAAELAREKGRIVAIGATGLDLPRRALYQKELSLVVSRSSGPGRYDTDYEERGRDYPLSHIRWTERENMRAFLELLADERVDVRPLISHRFEIGDGERAYGALDDANSLGILFEYPPTAAGTALVRERRASRTTAIDGRPRISVIGAGRFARGVLLPSLVRSGAATLGGVVAATGLSASSAAARFGFDYCSTTADEIWRDASTNAVVIATRHDAHARLTIAALQARKAVFVEKPLCINDAELDRIVQVVSTLRAAGEAPFVMVGFNRRFAPAVRAARARTAGVPLSIVYRVNAGRIPPSSWIGDPDEGGGRIVGELCHFIDLCAYLAGAPVGSVFAVRSAAGADDVMVTLTLTNGSIATIAYLVDGDRTASKERIEILGGGTGAVIDDFRSGWGPFGRRDKGHAAEVAAFVQAVASGAGSPIPFEAAVNCTRATFAVLRSLESGSPVDVA